MTERDPLADQKAAIIAYPQAPPVVALPRLLNAEKD